MRCRGAWDRITRSRPSCTTWCIPQSIPHTSQILLYGSCLHGICLSINCLLLSIDPNSSQSHSICLRANRPLKTYIRLILYNIPMNPKSPSSHDLCKPGIHHKSGSNTLDASKNLQVSSYYRSSTSTWADRNPNTRSRSCAKPCFILNIDVQPIKYLHRVFMSRMSGAIS